MTTERYISKYGYDPSENTVWRYLDNYAEDSEKQPIGRGYHLDPKRLEENFYSNIMEYAIDGWGFYGVEDYGYNSAMKTIQELKRSGRKVKAVVRGSKVLIFTKHKGEF